MCKLMFTKPVCSRQLGTRLFVVAREVQGGGSQEARGKGWEGVSDALQAEGLHV
jgi:hypothetical protein